MTVVKEVKDQTSKFRRSEAGTILFTANVTVGSTKNTW